MVGAVKTAGDRRGLKRIRLRRNVFRLPPLRSGRGRRRSYQGLSRRQGTASLRLRRPLTPSLCGPGSRAAVGLVASPVATRRRQTARVAGACQTWLRWSGRVAMRRDLLGEGEVPLDRGGIRSRGFLLCGRGRQVVGVSLSGYSGRRRVENRSRAAARTAGRRRPGGALDQATAGAPTP